MATRNAGIISKIMFNSNSNSINLSKSTDSRSPMKIIDLVMDSDGESDPESFFSHSSSSPSLGLSTIRHTAANYNGKKSNKPLEKIIDPQKREIIDLVSDSDGDSTRSSDSEPSDRTPPSPNDDENTGNDDDETIGTGNDEATNDLSFNKEMRTKRERENDEKIDQEKINKKIKSSSSSSALSRLVKEEFKCSSVEFGAADIIDEVEEIGVTDTTTDTSPMNRIMKEENDFDDIVIVGGNLITASDMPHQRESCSIYPFTPIQSSSYENSNRLFCLKCYCYVCDIIASDCIDWKENHCNASFKQSKWKEMKSSVRVKLMALIIGIFPSPSDRSQFLDTLEKKLSAIQSNRSDPSLGVEKLSSLILG
jgi:hypothetical protein